MWTYEKKLEYPVNIKTPNPKLAMAIISQLGGPDGELAASQRYLSQRYSMPYPKVAGLLTDIGTEELAHLEIVSAIVYQLTRNISIDEIKRATSTPITSITRRASTRRLRQAGPLRPNPSNQRGDALTDLFEDMGAEQKARTTYDNLLRLIDDPDVRDPIKFLREREVVHFQRFGEALGIVQDELDSKTSTLITRNSIDNRMSPPKRRFGGAFFKGSPTLRADVWHSQ